MWWSWELLMGLAGTLGAINLAAHASLTSMVSLYWSWIGCTSMTSCVRVGNHLGAGDADSARCAAKVPVIFLAVILLVVWIACMTMRDSFAFLYTADPQVAAAAASVLPLYLFSQSCAACSFGFKGCLDGCGADNRFFQFVCDRLSRACLGTSSRFSYENSRKGRFLSALQGRKQIQMAFARYSMASWYFVGIPLAAAAVLYFDLGLAGQWTGMCIGNATCLTGVGLYCRRLDFDAISRDAVANAKASSKPRP